MGLSVEMSHGLGAYLRLIPPANAAPRQCSRAACAITWRWFRRFAADRGAGPFHALEPDRLARRSVQRNAI
jgi:hypothetical protein